jgi:arylsulfatase A-like enzyme
MSIDHRAAHRRLIPMGVLVTLAMALGAFALLRCSPRPQPNVLFITMDSLRHDHLGCCGYERARTPNIDALARDGAVFRETVAQGVSTPVSLPSFITGKFPVFTRIHTFNKKLDSLHTTLAEVLSADGYTTLASNLMFSTSLYQGFDKLGGADSKTPERTDWTIQALEEYGRHRFFIWLYYWDPHTDYDPPEEFIRAYEPDYVKIPAGKGMARWRGKNDKMRDHTGLYNGSTATLLNANLGKITLTPRDREHIINLYDAEISYVDAEIGKVMAKLKEMDLYDNTVIVLNSDHGEAFGEHGKYFHDITVYDEMARVPLIIKPPHSRDKNKAVWGQVRNIDIMPTILDYCGLKSPQECDGQSLRPYIEGDATPDLPSVTETRGAVRFYLVAYRHGGRKLIYDLDHKRAWLYDLQKDPAERNSLLPDSAAIEPGPEETSSPGRKIEQQMRRELLDLLSLQRLADLRPTEKDLEKLDEKTKDRLRALGYVY